MQYGIHDVSRYQVSSYFLLLTDPREFYFIHCPRASSAWGCLLTVSALAALLDGSTQDISSAVFCAIVFFLNAVGMTCIFSGLVFVFAKIFPGPGLSLGHTFTICAFASLGPILISWVPGAMWIADPWRWWTTAIGLSACIPSGMRKTVSIVICALGTMYVMFRGAISFV